MAYPRGGDGSGGTATADAVYEQHTIYIAGGGFELLNMPSAPGISAPLNVQSSIPQNELCTPKKEKKTCLGVFAGSTNCVPAEPSKVKVLLMPYLNPKFIKPLVPLVGV